MSKLAPENVWDYPRPPRLEPCKELLRIEHRGELIAQTQAGYRVLETSHPPTYYLPREDVNKDVLEASERRSFCEYKGQAQYFHLRINGELIHDVAWTYPTPSPAFLPIAHYVAFYANKLDACYVGDERVIPQEGDFYGGWLTANIQGPTKGAPGTEGW